VCSPDSVRHLHAADDFPDVLKAIAVPEIANARNAVIAFHRPADFTRLARKTALSG